MIVQAKMVMKDLGLRRDEVAIILSACDHNQDGFLDAYELDHLRRLAKQARDAHKVKVVVIVVVVIPPPLNINHLSIMDGWQAKSLSLWGLFILFF